MPRKEPDFEESADMRLVDLQRASLGMQAPERSGWETHIQAEGGSVQAEPPAQLSSAVLAVEITATPPGEVIPGALVTIALAVVNEGAKPAQEVRVGVPLPGAVAYRNGSFVRDGRPERDDVADELFGSGLALGTVAPGSRITLLWKISVRLGNKPLIMSPTVTAGDCAILGANTLSISRKETPRAAFSAEVGRVDPALYEPARAGTELPFYELDDEETIEYEAGDAALSSSIAEIPAPPATQPEPAPPITQPVPDPEPGRPDIEPSIPEPPQQPPDLEPAAREGVLLVGRIDRPSLAYFERIFNGTKAPTLLNHFILGGALACIKTARGQDPASLKAHMDAQGQLLQRVVLHERLGKKEPIGEYTGAMLARVDGFTPEPLRPLAPSSDQNELVLFTELEAPTLGLLRKMQEDAVRWDFTKARQLTLALQARSVVSSAPRDRAEAAERALRIYAQTAATQLQRFFVRMRIDRTTGLLFASDETLDASARVLIASLSALF